MKIRWTGWLAAALLAAPLGAWAQNVSPAALVGVAHIALRVSDVEREVNFLGKLGFIQAFANVENGRTLEAFVKVNDRQFIEVYPPSAAGEAPGPLGLMHVCYEAADLKALDDRYLAAGLKPTAWRKAGAGNLLFNVQDPDGRVTEFTQYLPDSRQMDDAGQHLSAERVSDELLGFEMPVQDIERAQKFYEALGFDAEPEGTIVRLSLKANPDLRIVLHPVRTNDRPQFLLPVDDARKTADELQRAGLLTQRSNKLVFVRDPDGNTFVLLETGDHSPRHAQ